MKKFYGILFLLALMAFKTDLQAQTPCDAVTVTVIAPSPQTGTNNYFGVRVSLAQVYNQDVIVEGYIYETEGGARVDNPYSLTIPTGSLTAETDLYFFATGPASSATATISSVSPCPEVTGTYAGVTIRYETNNNILRFNSIQDVNTVLDQLDADYENHNDNYDNQYPNLTADQLDDMDAQTGFDEFKPFRDFENLFSGFSSKRAAIENTEITWLNNNFGGVDPDDIDLTFDDAQNTIFNGDNSFKVGNDLYQLTTTGLYLNGTLQVRGVLKDYGNSIAKNNEIGKNGIFQNVGYNISGPMTVVYDNYSISSPTYPGCNTNKKLKSPPYEPAGTGRRFELKVAINSIGVRSSIKGKIVHFKLKSGSWKRARADMAVGVQGIVYSTSCVSKGHKSKSNPQTGYKKRRQLKAKDWEFGTIWKTYSGEVSGSFATPEGFGGSLPLTW